MVCVDALHGSRRFRKTAAGTLSLPRCAPSPLMSLQPFTATDLERLLWPFAPLPALKLLFAPWL